MQKWPLRCESLPARPRLTSHQAGGAYHTSLRSHAVPSFWNMVMLPFPFLQLRCPFLMETLPDAPRLESPLCSHSLHNSCSPKSLQ